MQLAAVLADVALDVAAPDEAAVALLFDVLQARLVAAAAAHQTAAVHRLARLVAAPAARPQHAHPAVHQTVQLRN